MGMDGFFRPTESLGYMDTLGYLNAADRVAEEDKRTHTIGQNRAVDDVDADGKGQQGKKKQPQKKPDDTFEQELQEILTREFHLQFDPDGQYFFDYNESMDRIELIDLRTNKVILTLAPDELMRVTENLRRNSGIITDRFG